MSGQPVILQHSHHTLVALNPTNPHSPGIADLLAQAPGFTAFLRGPDHVIEMANANYLKLVGHRDVIGRPVAQALPDAVAQGYLQLLDHVYATGEGYAADSASYDVQPLAGGPIDKRFVDFVFQPVQDAYGKVQGILVMGLDTTERESHRIQRERLLELTIALGDAHTSAEAGYVASKLLGESLEVSRVGYGTIDHIQDTLEVEKDWHARGVESLSGITHLREYGSFIDSLKLGQFISIADVREDPRTAQAAAALESKHARSFVNVPVIERGVLVAVFFVNCAQVRQWTDTDLQFIQEVGQRTRVTVERLRADGALRLSEAKLREINESLEAKVLERTEQLALVEAQYRHAQKMEAIGQLTGGLAHDLNNLLQTMSMSMQSLRRKLESGSVDGWNKPLDTGLGAVKRAASLTHRMLAFSRRQALDARSTAVGDLVLGLKELISGTIGPQIALHIEVRNPGQARIDRSQLENAVLNLCINARDAMQPQGGSLSLLVDNVVLDSDSSEGQIGDYVKITVTDTGTGMDPDVAARALDPFFTTKPLGQGTGLGLSMVYGFVSQSGGLVRIDSQIGKGTSISLYIPRIDEKETEEQTAAPTDGSENQTGVVLVVEDETDIREMIVEVLSVAGYQVIQAVDASAAMRAFQAHKQVDALVADVGLAGGLNGRQLADALRVAQPDLPTVFITGYAEVDLLKNVQMPQRTAILKKPFETEALLTTLVAALRKP